MFITFNLNCNYLFDTKKKKKFNGIEKKCPDFQQTAIFLLSLPIIYQRT